MVHSVCSNMAVSVSLICQGVTHVLKLGFLTRRKNPPDIGAYSPLNLQSYFTFWTVVVHFTTSTYVFNLNILKAIDYVFPHFLNTKKLGGLSKHLLL